MITVVLQGEAIMGKRFSVIAEYVLKVLGLDYIAGGDLKLQMYQSYEWPDCTLQGDEMSFGFELTRLISN